MKYKLNIVVIFLSPWTFYVEFEYYIAIVIDEW